MSETFDANGANQNHEANDKYFSFQIKGWTDFDPMDRTLAKVAEGIERGNGFLTMVEVLKVEDNVTSIQDDDVRACFENLLAAKRLIRNANELPARVKEELRAALKNGDEVAPNKIVTLVRSTPANPEPQLRNVGRNRKGNSGRERTICPLLQYLDPGPPISTDSGSIAILKWHDSCRFAADGGVMECDHGSGIRSSI